MPYQAPTTTRHWDPTYSDTTAGPGHPQGPPLTRRQRRASRNPHWTDPISLHAGGQMHLQPPVPPQMPIPPTPDLMNTIPPGVPGIDPRVPLQPPVPPQMPIPPTPDLMNTIPPGTPGIPDRSFPISDLENIKPTHLPGSLDQLSQVEPTYRIVQPGDPEDYVSDSPSEWGYFPDQRGGGFQKPTYANTHGARAPITNAPRPGGLLNQIVGNMRLRRNR